MANNTSCNPGCLVVPLIIIGGIYLESLFPNLSKIIMWIFIGAFGLFLIFIFFFSSLLGSWGRSQYPYDYILNLLPYVNYFCRRGYDVIELTDPDTKNPGIVLGIDNSGTDKNPNLRRVHIILHVRTFRSSKIEVSLPSGTKWIFSGKVTEEELPSILNTTFGDRECKDYKPMTMKDVFRHISERSRSLIMLGQPISFGPLKTHNKTNV